MRPRREDSGSSTEDATIARLPVGDGSVRDGTEHASSSGQVDFSWVADEPLEEESGFCDEAIVAYAMVETIGREDPPNWYCCAPKEEDRICHHFPGKQFTMYEFAFREAGIRLPFNSFQMSVFKWLRLAPSQLHPNALAFMRAFELVCQFLGIGCTRALFFHVFHLQRSGSRGRHSWVSFKQPVRLFKTYEDSVRHFKNRWYVVMPITRAALHSLYYYQRKPNGEETLMSKIPLRWQRDHFDLSTAHYRVKYAMLGEEDRLAYKKLVDYVQSFSLGFWANRQGVPYLDEAGELITETRYINTKALLECDTEEEALALLSRQTLFSFLFLFMTSLANVCV